MVKHLTRTEDLTTEEYLKLCERAEIFERGLKEGKDFTHLCPGKVIATEFFQESTRTSASLQAAMTRLGGGWFGVSGTAGTYIAAGEEDLEDTLRAVALFCDIMAVRHGSFDLTEFSKKGFPVPLMNAMCGGEEHTLTIGFLYVLKKRLRDIKGIKIGLYGSSGGSRAVKAAVKILSRFGMHFYDDSVVPEFKIPEDIRNTFEKHDSTYKEDKLKNFISEVDYLLIEGNPQAGTDPAIVDKFNKAFVSFSNAHLAKMKESALVDVIEPRIMSDGKYTALKETDNDPRMVNKELLEAMLYTNMAVITYLLGVEVS